MNPPEEMK
jgi:superfamily II DNA/RNA helicase